MAFFRLRDALLGFPGFPVLYGAGGSQATSSSMFYHIIRAGIGVFSLFGLTKSCPFPKLRTQPPLLFIQPPKENTEIATLYVAT